MFQYLVGSPWQPSAALGAPNQAVSGGLCPTIQDPLDSVRELFSEFKEEPEEFTDLETVEVTIDSVGITPPPGTTCTGPKS
jgi:hypothetical protein